MNLNSTAIRTVSFAKTIGDTCDRCGTGIKNVFFVHYSDGTTQRYGSECIRKILDNQPTLRKLFDKNAKLLAKYQDYQRILSGPVESMPQGSEYYGSGMRMIADSTGKDIIGGGRFGHFLFHPIYDAEKNAAGRSYVVSNPAERLARTTKEIADFNVWLQDEIARIEGFLAKILRNVKQ